MGENGRIDGRALRFQNRRPELLAAAAEYVLDHGPGDLSLRPMATALGTTHATLIRHFKNKEALLEEVLGYALRTLSEQLANDEELLAAASALDQVRILWRRWEDPKEHRQFFVFAEMYGLARRDPKRFGRLVEVGARDWLGLVEAALLADGWPETRVPALATTILAQIRGLQLDLLATGDRERVDEAFENFVSMLERSR